jgi:hypothetical protein
MLIPELVGAEMLPVTEIDSSPTSELTEDGSIANKDSTSVAKTVEIPPFIPHS